MKLKEMYYCAHCGALHTLNELDTVTVREPHGEVHNKIICATCGSDEIAQLPDDFMDIWGSVLDLATMIYEGRGCDIEDFEDGEEILEEYEEMMGLYDEEAEDIDLTEREDFFHDIANKIELIGAQ